MVSSSIGSQGEELILTEKDAVLIRAVEDADLGEIVALDEKVTGKYRPDVWENGWAITCGAIRKLRS